MDDVRRNKDEIQCKTCYDVIWKHAETALYINGICPNCRRLLPYYIPEDQQVRFLLALGKARKKWYEDNYG